jgi:Holliday junction resolvase-like predicted endonuclease
MSYYQRQTRTDANGLRVFSTPADREAEDRAAAILERRWNCKLHRYEPFDRIDWYASRDGETVAFIELKTRSHPAGQYPTVFLNYRKYRELFSSWENSRKPHLFVVQFQDQLRYIDVLCIDATRIPVRGCNRIVKSPLDVEPVIEVPVSSMKVLSQGGE